MIIIAFVFSFCNKKNISVFDTKKSPFFDDFFVFSCGIYADFYDFFDGFYDLRRMNFVIFTLDVILYRVFQT